MATFVLVHGSYQGGWIWQPVANRLRQAGHQVYAPSLDGCGERKGTVRPGITTESQADEVAQLLFYEDLKDVVLAGTSSGGMVACRIAELMRDRIGRLVFVDALALLPGEKIGDIVTRSTAAANPGGLTRGPSRDDAANRLFADLDPSPRDSPASRLFADPAPGTRAWALDGYTQHPAAIYTESVRLASFWSQKWRADVVWCRRAQNPGEAHQRRTADKLGGKWHELDTGH